MSQQKCKHCGEPVNERRSECPYCGSDLRSGNENVISPEQEERIVSKVKKKVIRWMIYVAIPGIAIIFTIFGFSIDKAYKIATSNIENFLVNRISQEFEEPRIKETVQEVAATNAERMLLEQLRPEIRKFKAEVETSLKETLELIASARDQLKLIELQNAAYYGSRKAFVALTELASRDDSLGIKARNSVENIETELELMLYSSVPGLSLILRWTLDGKDILAGELSTHHLFIEGLESRFFQKEHIPAMMRYILEKPKNEILKEAKRVLETSDYLPACAATCEILRKKLGDKAEFLAFDDWIKVLEEEIEKNK